jgi:transposase-like protein
MAKYTFKQFQAEYPNDAACLAKLMEMQYGGDVTHCQVCDRRTKFHPMTKRRAYACQECGHHIYPAAGTIFHKSSTSLTKWFFAMYLMTSTRHGVAAKEVERQLGVTYKCAWRMCHELRKLMAATDADLRRPLTGHVEIDETFVGGVAKGGATMSRTNKIVVFGMVERGGRIIAGPVPDVSAYTLEGIIYDNVANDATISTDKHGSYGDLGKTYKEHGTVDHGRKEYVRGIHHVNTLEGHWGHFKRAVAGTHIHISAKHSWKYIAEFSYRRNFRHSHWAMFNLLISGFALPRLKDA